MSPITKAAPLRIRIEATAQSRGLRWIRPERYSTPAALALPPMAARKRSKPIPGLPPGKLEKSVVHTFSG
jgi:hypothetical protein